MKYENVILSGSLQVSGSLVLPSGPTNPSTANAGDLFFNTTSGKAFGYRDEDGWNDLSSMTTYVPGLENVEYLVVAGGGSGGGWGGGGGAGGMLTGTLSTKINSGSVLDIVVGAGANYNAYGTSDGDYEQGLNGSSSSLAPNSGYSFTRIDTVGGGGGGDYVSGNATAGSDGGSGGGAAARHTSYSGASGGSGTAGQGNSGGSTAASGNYYPGGGGGGGAGQVGQDGSGNTGGPGGSGSLSTITGTATFYAGGGSGHSSRTDDNPGTPTAPGGGGDGGRYATSGGTVSSIAAVDGTANTGGGGGGGYGYNPYVVGKGGSGIVVLAHSSVTVGSRGGVRRYYNSNGKVAHIFNSSGQFTVEGTKTLTHDTLDVFGDSSCLALYQLDGNANDKSGNYNGTASNVTYAQGYINDAGVFNGSSSIIALHSTAFKLTTYSFSGWIYSDDYNQSGVGIYDGGLEQPGNGTWYGLSIIVNSSKISSYGGDVAGVGGSGFYTGGSSNTTLSNGTWNHVVFVISGTSITGYINGSQDTGLSRTLGANIQYASTSNTFHLGSRKGTFGTYGYFNGKIDQARIFNKALSASEITTLYKE